MPGFEETDEQISYRVRDPADFRDGTFRTKDLGDGVSIITGKLEEPGEEHDADSMVTQSVRFEKDDDWTLAKAKMWVKEHDLRRPRGFVGRLGALDARTGRGPQSQLQLSGVGGRKNFRADARQENPDDERGAQQVTDSERPTQAQHEL